MQILNNEDMSFAMEQHIRAGTFLASGYLLPKEPGTPDADEVRSRTRSKRCAV